MKEAEVALRSGLKRIADQETATRDAERANATNRRPEFHILQLES
jgi:hypothetical protein